MKNFQQTPKPRQRRQQLQKQRQRLATSVPRTFQPKEAWSNKRKVNGVALSVLETKQDAAQWSGYNSYCPRIG